MNDTYKTIKNNSEGSFKDRGSKFMAFAFPVDNEEEINQYRAELKKKYYDARHHVYAFHLGVEHPFFRASDDGEPTNSSGPPVLGQIRSFGLTDVLIVVVRYFGGTKLGVPGLINAYKSAALDALTNADIIEKNIEIPIKIAFKYADLNEVMRLAKKDGVRVTNQQFAMDCLLELMVRKGLYQLLVENIRNMHNLQIID